MGLRENTSLKKTTEIPAQNVASQSYKTPRHYRDADVELDALERLKSNILMLDDLQKRLRFMNSEIESVIGSRKKI